MYTLVHKKKKKTKSEVGKHSWKDKSSDGGTLKKISIDLKLAGIEYQRVFVKP